MERGLLLYREEIHLFELVENKLNLYLPLKDDITLQDFKNMETVMKNSDDFDDYVIGRTATRNDIYIKLGSLMSRNLQGQKIYKVYYYIVGEAKSELIKGRSFDEIRLISPTITQYLTPLLNEAIQREVDPNFQNITQVYSPLKKTEVKVENHFNLKSLYIKGNFNITFKKKLNGITYKPYLGLKFKKQTINTNFLIDYIQGIKNSFLYLRGYNHPEHIDIELYDGANRVGELIIPDNPNPIPDSELLLTVTEIPFENYAKLVGKILENKIPLEFVGNKKKLNTTDMSQIIFRAVTLEGIAKQSTAEIYYRDRLRYLFNSHTETISVFISYLSNFAKGEKLEIESIIERIRDVRNKIAHGDIGWDTQALNIYDFIIAEILIYLWIYKKIGLSDKESKVAIAKLYGFNISFDD